MESNTTPATDHQSFAALLQSAITNPGKIHAGYSAFWNYSIGNQLAAIGQCWQRGITPGPIATFPKWKSLGRYVRKGEKAIFLCQPITIKRKAEEATEPNEITFTRFVWKPSWFVLGQTDGQPLAQPTTPEWDKDRALAALNVQETGFESLNGNTMGYARERSIAINPVNPLPWKTRSHELAHVLLGHTAEGTEHSDGEVTPRNLKECEAESVALLCCAALNLPGVEFSRGYIQSWWGAGNPIPERSAQRILKVADQILRAGRPQESTEAAS